MKTSHVIIIVVYILCYYTILLLRLCVFMIKRLNSTLYFIHSNNKGIKQKKNNLR